MTFPTENQDPQAHIDRYRRMIEVHSILYYSLDNNIWTDAQFDKACETLVRLQKEYPKEARKGYKPKEFKDFTGDTGMHLTRDSSRHGLAAWLIKYNEKS